MTTTHDLRVAVDVRCLDTPKLRGFARYTSELLKGLTHLGGVDVVAVSDRPMTLRVEEEHVQVHAPDGGREWRREQVALPRLVADLEADVLLSPANRGLPLVGVPSVLVLHDAVEWNRRLVARPSGRDRIRFGYSNVASLLGATRIITVSNHSAEQLHSRLGLRRDRITVVPEAAGGRFVPGVSAEMRAAARQKIGIEDPFVLYCGGFDPKKSVDTLVIAWALLGEGAPSLVLAGAVGTSQAEHLRALAAGLGADTERLHLPGYVDDDQLPALMAEADMFVFPGTAEGWGLPAVEAMAVGTATVVADSGALPQSTHNLAVRFAAGDAAGLAGALGRLLGDEALRRHLGRQGSAAQIQRSWLDVAQDTLVVLREAASVGAVERLGAAAAQLPRAYRWVV